MGSPDPELGAKIQRLKERIGDDPNLLEWLSIVREFFSLVGSWKSDEEHD